MVAKTFPKIKSFITQPQEPIRTPQAEITRYPDTSTSFVDSRDMEDRLKNENDDSNSVSGDSTSSSIDDKTNHAVAEMEAALKIQKKRLGRHHPSVTRSLHALALEYKAQGKFDRAIVYIKDALENLDEKLELIVAEIEADEDYAKVDVSRKRHESKLSIVKERAPNATKLYIVHLLEEKSVFYSCLANLYRERSMYKDAMENYVESVNMLVEADYAGDSPRVSMMLRIMKRMENERKNQSKEKREGN